MRLRRMSHLLWGTTFVVCCIVLYVITNLSLKLPSIRPGERDYDEESNKLRQFENKLKNIEAALNEHNLVVGAIQNVVENFKPDNSEVKEDAKPHKTNIKKSEPAGLEDDERRSERSIVYDRQKCALRMETIPSTDVQMLQMYEKMDFEDIDGGVWKQGWRIEYDEAQWSSKNKLRVFLVPHSHNDPGWIKTFEEYYRTQTRQIFQNMIEKLSEDTKRKFIWAEVSFLSLWWDHATPHDKTLMKLFLQSGQLEIVTGGWVMNDEANSHWLSILQQLTNGHQWLINNIGYIPKSAWSIDPFGHSSTQPYLLHLAGLNNSLIQRVHYRVKKELALNKQLEFRWRQMWDGVGKTDMLTHMMPFYSYDIPHTCGPDPKICCQFDFRRLPGSGVTCPWKISPKPITDHNVAERSLLILDQWRKKAQLYKSNVVFIPLGDDFRWDTDSEWDQQLNNYDVLIQHINTNPKLHAEVSYGTLSDYFKAMRAELKTSQLPTLSGDFFTYADRNQHYWSGYYTTRPYYKHMDRELLAYVRAAELLTAQVTESRFANEVTTLRFRDLVQTARDALALFQHHDGVTGTARDPVVDDYASKMQKAIKHCQSVIQEAAYLQLGKPELEGQTREDVFLEVSELNTPTTIVIGTASPRVSLVLHNSLSFHRTEIVTVYVTHAYMQIFDEDSNPIKAQISPVVTNGASITNTKFALSFVANVPAMSLVNYHLVADSPDANYGHISFASVRIYNTEAPMQIDNVFAVNREGEASGVISLRLSGESVLTVSEKGYLRAIQTPDGPVPVHMDLVTYESNTAHDNNSGAYLFIPKGQARELQEPSPLPAVIVIEGEIISSVTTKHPLMLQTYTAVKNPSKPQVEIRINNLVDITSVEDTELAMRVSTKIENQNVFYTDLNGNQIIRREYQPKLPLQANFYPFPSAAYIQDNNKRLTILTSTSLGIAALKPGQIEIMQDRRLTRDDNLGLGQGITDNVLTSHAFVLLVENSQPGCQQIVPGHPSGALTVAAHVAMQLLLSPIIHMNYRPAASAAITHAPRRRGTFVDVNVASYRSHLTGNWKNDKVLRGSGITIQRSYLDLCYGDTGILESYPIGNGKVELRDLIDFPTGSLYECTLTANQIGSPIPSSSLNLCPMEIVSIFINQTYHER